jgi:hypothetical protein
LSIGPEAGERLGRVTVVASISARGGVQAALGYYAHLGQDDYYLRDGDSSESV